MYEMLKLNLCWKIEIFFYKAESPKVCYIKLFGLTFFVPIFKNFIIKKIYN